jgi:uncharacterized repeat protein (TIGR03803 family)
MKYLIKTLLLFFVLHGSSMQAFTQPKLWGTLPYAGKPGAGLICEIDLNGNQMSDIHAFSKYEGKQSRHEALLADNNKLYGIAVGGMFQFGCILYEYDPATGQYNIIHDFHDPDAWVGLAANAGYLMQASNGLIYGFNQNGGPTQDGQLFSYDPSSGVFEYLADFEASTTGSIPAGVLTEAANGKLYGVTNEGGVCNYGTIFSYDIESGIIVQEHCFDWLDGADPVDGMCLASNGLLYGMTNAGGGSGDGVIYSYETTTGILTLLHEFNTAAHGGKPYGRLYQASDGNLYGMASTGGLNGDGILFRYDPDLDLFALRINFDGTNGADPNGNLVECEGSLYGMTTEGGVNNEGTLFRYDMTANQLTKLADFYGDDYGRYPYGSLTAGQDGILYGQTYSGGKNDNGVMFEYYTATLVFLKRFDFGQSDNGAMSISSLMTGNDGWVYGTTYGGGQYNGGTIYRINPADRIFESLYEFDIYTYGGNPTTGLIQATDGYFYGTTPFGGTVGAGVIYRFDANNKIVTVLEDLITPSQGSRPSGPPVQASDGFLYGLTRQGGAMGHGALYKFNLSISTYTKLADFQDAASGSRPEGSLVEAANGKLYALANEGGQFGFGTLFEYDPTGGTFFTMAHFDGLNKGAGPVTTLLEYEDNQLYGVCLEGGVYGKGTMFAYDAVSGTCSKVHDFGAAADGTNPMGPLMKASNGKIYGTANSGGTYGYGIIFEYSPSTADYAIIHEFSSHREMPWFSALLEVETDFGTGEEPENPFYLSVFPNPARDHLMLSIQGLDSEARLILTDMLGNTILFKDLVPGKNPETLDRLDIQRLPAGMYLLTMQDGRKSISKKIIIR